MYNEVDKSWACNLDNKYLLHNQRINPDTAKLIEFWFSYGLLFVGLGLIEDKQNENEINNALKGAAATIIPTIELHQMKDSKTSF